MNEETASTVPKAFIEPAPGVFGTLLGAKLDPITSAQDKSVSFHMEVIDVAFLVGNNVGFSRVVMFKNHGAKRLGVRQFNMLDDGFDAFSVDLCPDISVDGDRGSPPRAVAEEVIEELFRKHTAQEK